MWRTNFALETTSVPSSLETGPVVHITRLITYYKGPYRVNAGSIGDQLVPMMALYKVTAQEINTMMSVLYKGRRFKLLYGEGLALGPDVKDPKTWYVNWVDAFATMAREKRGSADIAQALSRIFYMYEFDADTVSLAKTHFKLE